MDWEASHLGPSLCSACNQDCFPPHLLLPQLLSDSSQLRASNILPVLVSCGHLFHQHCYRIHQKCPVDGCDILPILMTEKSSSSWFTFFTLRRARGFPSRFFGEDDFILQFTLAHYSKSGPLMPRVLTVDIVTNTPLKAKFDKQKEGLAKKGLGSSLLLYHGTPYANVESICRDNFNLATVANGRAHGNGVYFSERWDREFFMHF